MHPFALNSPEIRKLKYICHITWPTSVSIYDKNLKVHVGAAISCVKLLKP